MDVNECALEACIGPAANFCKNWEGSWECGCSEGYYRETPQVRIENSLIFDSIC